MAKKPANLNPDNKLPLPAFEPSNIHDSSGGTAGASSGLNRVFEAGETCTLVIQVTGNGQPITTTMWVEVFGQWLNHGPEKSSRTGTWTVQVNLPACSGCPLVKVHDDQVDKSSNPRPTWGLVGPDGRTVIAAEFERRIANKSADGSDGIVMKSPYDQSSDDDLFSLKKGQRVIVQVALQQIIDTSATLKGLRSITIPSTPGLPQNNDPNLSSASPVSTHPFLTSPVTSDTKPMDSGLKDVTLACGTPPIVLEADTSIAGYPVSWAVTPFQSADKDVPFISKFGHFAQLSTNKAGMWVVSIAINGAAPSKFWLVTFIKITVDSATFSTNPTSGWFTDHGKLEGWGTSSGPKVGRFFNDSPSSPQGFSVAAALTCSAGMDDIAIATNLDRLSVGIVQTMIEDSSKGFYDGDNVEATTYSAPMPMLDTGNTSSKDPLMTANAAMIQKEVSKGAKKTIAYCDSPGYLLPDKHKTSGGALARVGGKGVFRTGIAVRSQHAPFTYVILKEVTWTVNLDGTVSGTTWSPGAAAGFSPSGGALGEPQKGPFTLSGRLTIEPGITTYSP